MRPCALLAALLLPLLSLAAGPATSPALPPADAPPFPLEQVRPGLVGTGFTVLRGDTVAAFQAQVQGVVSQDASRGPLIICELSGAGIEETGVLAAMSGSPVFAEGKLLGAVAYAWPFAKRPVCGLTPAAQLLPMLDDSPSAGGAGGVPVTSSDFLSRFGRAGARVPSPDEGGAPGPLGSLALAGFRWSLAAPGAAPPAAPVSLGPGGLVGVLLVAGDVEFAAFGTVAHVRGDRFVAFGHPFMRLGAVDLPLVAARVDALVPSLEKGMKLCSSGPAVGAVRLDSSAGVSGRFGVSADLLPVALTVSGGVGPARTFHFGLARHRFLTPALLQGALGAIQNSAVGVADPKTVTLARFQATLPDGETVSLNPLCFSGPAPMAPLNDLAGNLLDLLLNNAYEPVAVKALSLEIAVRPVLAGGAPQAAWLEPGTVTRGSSPELRVSFQPLQAPSGTLSKRLPTDRWPEGELVLWVGDVFTLWRKLSGTEGVTPSSRQGILDFVRSIPANDRLYVAVLSPSPGRVLQNRRLDDPPPSLAALLGPSGPRTAAAPPAYRLVEVLEGPESGLCEGLIEVPLTVKPPAAPAGPDPTRRP